MWGTVVTGVKHTGRKDNTVWPGGRQWLTNERCCQHMCKYVDIFPNQTGVWKCLLDSTSETVN